MNNFLNLFIFSEISITKSAHDAKRPYLFKVRLKYFTENHETWELYADGSSGYEGINSASTYHQ